MVFLLTTNRADLLEPALASRRRPQVRLAMGRTARTVLLHYGGAVAATFVTFFQIISTPFFRSRRPREAARSGSKRS